MLRCCCERRPVRILHSVEHAYLTTNLVYLEYLSNTQHSWHGPALTRTLIVVPGRVVLLVRNVGIHLYTDAVTTADGQVQSIPISVLHARQYNLPGTDEAHRATACRDKSCSGMAWCVQTGTALIGRNSGTVLAELMWWYRFGR